MKILIALAAALVVASSLSNAQNLSYNLTSNNSSLLGYGESRTFTSGGVTMTASAISYTGGNNEYFEAARLGQYSEGLGVSNKHEDGSAPSHRVDNFQHNDYILFTFDNLVDIKSFTIASIVDDSDVSYWVGNLKSASDSKISYADLALFGFGNEQTNMIDANLNQRDVAINSPSSGINAIIFGAQRGLDSGKTLDQFKIKHIKGHVVPEPSAALLSVIGALGFCLRRRR